MELLVPHRAPPQADCRMPANLLEDTGEIKYPGWIKTSNNNFGKNKFG